MPTFKQAMIQYREYWKESLLIGFLSLICVMAAPFIPLLGPFILSLLLLSFQSIVWFWLDKKRWPEFSELFPRIVIPLLVCSLVMTPTSILIGSASGLLQSPQSFLTSWPLALAIIFLGLYFYFLIARALLMALSNTPLGIAKALDQAALDSIKNFKKMTPLCLTFSTLILLSQVTWGTIWFLTLPLLYYSTAYTLKK